MGVLSALAVLTAALSLTSLPGNVGQLIVFGLMLVFYGYSAFYLLHPTLLKSHFKNESA